MLLRIKKNAMSLMDSLQSILPKVLNRRGLRTEADASFVVYRAQQWLAVALPRFADALLVTTFSHSTLNISSRHGIASQECQQLLSALQDYLRRECGVKTAPAIRLVRERK